MSANSCNIFAVIKGFGEFVESPLNVAVVATDSKNITLKCASRRNNSGLFLNIASNHNDTNMIWSVKKNVNSLITNSHATNPGFPRHSVHGYPYRIDMLIRSVLSEDAGRYICGDLPTTKTVSAELIVLGQYV